MKKIKFDMRHIYIYASAVLLVGIGVGYSVKTMWPKNYSPSAVVIVADDTVEAPRSLLAFLEDRAKSDCEGYRGTDSEKGVSIYSVYQVVQDKYARVAMGCSTNLVEGATAIKTDDEWKLFSGASYYVSDLPRCSIIDEYRISKEFEPTCVEDDKVDSSPQAELKARENTNI